MNYNTIKYKWNVNKLANMLVQEEIMINNQNAHFVHLSNHQEVQRNLKRKGGRSKKK